MFLLTLHLLGGGGGGEKKKVSLQSFRRSLALSVWFQSKVHCLCCCGSLSWTVWAAFAAHERSWSVRGEGQVCVFTPPATETATAESVFRRRSLPTAFKSNRLLVFTEVCVRNVCVFCCIFLFFFSLALAVLSFVPRRLHSCMVCLWCACVCARNCVLGFFLRFKMSG